MTSIVLRAHTHTQDLVKLLHESEDPLWELIRFEAGMSAAQDEKVGREVSINALPQESPFTSCVILSLLGVNTGSWITTTTCACS